MQGVLETAAAGGTPGNQVRSVVADCIPRSDREEALTQELLESVIDPGAVELIDELGRDPLDKAELAISRDQERQTTIQALERSIDGDNEILRTPNRARMLIEDHSSLIRFGALLPGQEVLTGWWRRNPRP